jgi:hypothetical protein
LNTFLAATFWSGLGLFCKNHPGILLVVLGVAGEIICEWHKEKGKRGLLIKTFGLLLVVGLLLEIWEAVKSDKQVAELTERNLLLAKQLKDVDPLNGQINSVSAVLRLKIKGVHSTSLMNENIFLPPSSEEGQLNAGGGGIGFYEGQTNVMKEIYRLATGAGDTWSFGSGIVHGSNDWRGLVVRFHEDSLSDFESFTATNRFEIGQPARVFNKVGGLIIALPQMQTNVSVVSGVVELKVNSLRWTFPIPPQTQRYGFITSQFVTNAANQVDARIWRIPIADWSSPARFTNRVYTGEPY